jgi:hypothetical protein
MRTQLCREVLIILIGVSSAMLLSTENLDGGFVSSIVLKRLDIA